MPANIEKAGSMFLSRSHIRKARKPSAQKSIQFSAPYSVVEKPVQHYRSLTVFYRLVLTWKHLCSYCKLNLESASEFYKKKNSAAVTCAQQRYSKTTSVRLTDIFQFGNMEFRDQPFYETALYSEAYEICLSACGKLVSKQLVPYRVFDVRQEILTINGNGIHNILWHGQAKKSSVHFKSYSPYIEQNYWHSSKQDSDPPITIRFNASLNRDLTTNTEWLAI